MSIPEELPYKHNAKDLQDLNARIFTQGPVRDLTGTCTRSCCMSLGSPQDLLTRTCTGSCQGPLRDEFIRITSTRSSYKDLCKIMQGPLTVEDVSHIFTRSSHKDLYKIMQRTCPIKRIHQDIHNIFSQGSPQDLGQDLHNYITGTSKGAASNSWQDRDSRDDERDNGFVSACAFDMHMEMSQEQSYVRIEGKNAGSQMEHRTLIKHRP